MGLLLAQQGQWGWILGISARYVAYWIWSWVVDYQNERYRRDNTPMMLVYPSPHVSLYSLFSPHRLHLHLVVGVIQLMSIQISIIPSLFISWKLELYIRPCPDSRAHSHMSRLYSSLRSPLDESPHLLNKYYLLFPSIQWGTPNSNVTKTLGHTLRRLGQTQHRVWAAVIWSDLNTALPLVHSAPSSEVLISSSSNGL